MATALCPGLPLPSLNLMLLMERIQTFPAKQMVEEKTNLVGSTGCSFLCELLKFLLCFFKEKPTLLYNKSMKILLNEKKNFDFFC